MKYISGAVQRIQEHGVFTGSKVAGSEGIELLWRRVGKHVNYGEGPFTADWDILILLDACRYDLFEEFALNHSIANKFESVDSRYSPASTSIEWMNKVYKKAPQSILEDIHLVSGNGFEPQELDLDKFGAVSPVWEAHDSELKTIPPDRVTDAAIHAGRNTNCSRLIVHYMQPHAPFSHCLGKYNSVNEKPGQGRSQNVWEGLRTGQFDHENVWQDYGENLRTALDEVERLVTNISGSTVISADHGNAIGQWGVYGHPGHAPIPSLKRVPWVRLEASDNETVFPENPVTTGVSDTDVEDHLRDLGYVM